MAHEPVELRKVTPGYRTDDGRDQAAQLVRRFECSCGWKGACWYGSRQRARGHFDRHIEDAGGSS